MILHRSCARAGYESIAEHCTGNAQEPFRMISDTRIECRYANSQRESTWFEPTGSNRRGAQPGSPGSLSLDGFSSCKPERGPYLPSFRH